MARKITHLNTMVQDQKTITYEIDVDGEIYFVKDYYNVQGDEIEESTLYDSEGKQVDPNDVSTLAADIYAFCDDEIEMNDDELVMNPEDLPEEETNTPSSPPTPSTPPPPPEEIK